MNLLPFISVLAAWLATRMIKLSDEMMKAGKFEAWMLFVDGGMPSSHSAFVAGLATTVFLEQGASLLFLVTLVLAFVVAYDAMKVRWIVGEHSKSLNFLVHQKNKFEERVGHTFREVLGGVSVGIIVPLIAYFFLAS